MAENAAAKKGGKSGWLKAGVLGVLGLGGGAVGTYATAVVDRVVKPNKPVANFAVAADGLSVTCQNRATGESGWWDFGDGTPLEPFAPDQPAVAHAYAKPGTYAVKLTVRNFLLEENERSVPVEAAVAAKDAPPPDVAVLRAQPVSPQSVAPATFRLTGEVKNAEGTVWDFGDGRLEVGDASGPIDRLVTFEKPGTHTIQLISHGGKVAAKQTATVRVEPPQVGGLMVVVRVTDAGNKVDRVTIPASVSLAPPSAKGAAGTFEKVVAARPGYAVVEATLTSTGVPGVKNLKVQRTADGTGATVSGEWAGDAKVLSKAAGGSDVLIGVKLVQERTTAVQRPAETVTGVLAGGQIVLPLPPQPRGVAGVQRKMQLEIRRTTADGRSQVVANVPDLKLPWSAPVAGLAATPTGTLGAPAAAPVVTARQAGDGLVLTVGN